MQNSWVLFRDAPFREIAGKLNQLGLSSCPICGSDTALGADRRPVGLVVGQTIPAPGVSVPKEKSGNILFMLRVECNLCGYSMLFNAERFFSGDEPIFEGD